MGSAASKSIAKARLSRPQGELPMAARIPGLGLKLTTTKGSGAAADRHSALTTRREQEGTPGMRWDEPELILKGEIKAAADNIAGYLERTFELPKKAGQAR